MKYVYLKAAIRQPIRASAGVNLLLFSIVGIILALLAVLVYCTQRRKELSIQRALGVPGGRAVREALFPFALLSLAGTALGAAAFSSGAQKAREALQDVQSRSPLAFRFSPVTALLLALLAAWLGLHRLSRIPLLALL